MNFKVTPVPPPRRVPLGLQLKLLFGGAANLFGWLFGGFGMIFVWVFVANSTAVDWFTFIGEKHTVQGQVVDYIATGMEENETTVYKVIFRYNYDGQRYTATSYTLSQSFAPGQQVPVQVLQRNPEAACIPGLRRHPFGAITLIIFIFPLIGFTIIAFNFVEQLKLIHVARNYSFAEATVGVREPVPGAVKDGVPSQWNVRLRYKDRAGSEGDFILQTHSSNLYPEGETIAYLYDAADPKKFIPQPTEIRFNTLGEVANASPFRALLGPFIVVAVNALVAWLVLR